MGSALLVYEYRLTIFLFQKYKSIILSLTIITLVDISVSREYPPPLKIIWSQWRASGCSQKRDTIVIIGICQIESIRICRLESIGICHVEPIGVCHIYIRLVCFSYDLFGFVRKNVNIDFVKKKNMCLCVCV